MRLRILPFLIFAFVPLSIPSFALPSSKNTISIPGMLSNKVVLFQAFPYEVKPGGSLNLSGSGFSTKSNTVSFGGGIKVEATSTNGFNLKVMVPNTLSEGTYKLSVSNILGSSENPNIPVSVKITSNPISEPIITSAIFNIDTITLKGKGFTSTNGLITTMGNLNGAISTTGTELSFKVSDLSDYLKVKNTKKTASLSLPIWIFIQNEHGVSKTAYSVNIKIQ